MNTESNININGEMMRVRAEEMKMCAVTIGNTQYIAPQAVAKLIADLADQLRVEQQRRRKDDEDILRFIKKHASYIAYNLGGGEKERVSGNPAFCGENLLKYPVDHQVPLPDGVVPVRVFHSLWMNFPEHSSSQSFEYCSPTTPQLP